jgi:hypothetical protein
MKLPPPPTTARVRISFWRLSGAGFVDVPLAQARRVTRDLWASGAVVWHTAQLA